MGTISYNAANQALGYLYVASGGGTVFSANLKGTAAHDLFPNAYQANDAIYFSGNLYYVAFSDLEINVGTALDAGNTLVWEYYSGVSWIAMHDVTDNTNGFTTAGANTVVFPLQSSWTRVAVNGSPAAFWVRCRLTAVIGAPTEGGANQTTAVFSHSGFLQLTGYTSGAPCTMAALKTWTDANAPEIHFSQPTPNVYVLNYAILKMESYTTMFGETLILGDEAVRTNWGSSSGGGAYGNRFDYLIARNSNLIDYNGHFAIGTNTVMRGCGIWVMSYPDIAGTFYNCTFGKAEGANNFGIQIGVATFNGCRIEKVLTGGVSATFTNTKIVANSGTNHGYYVYVTDLSATGFDYEFETGSNGAMFWLYQTDDTKVTAINPATSFLNIDDATYNMVLLYHGGNYGTTGMFYDTSAGTYTTYAAFQNLPLYGDVGDIIYVAANLYSSGFTLNQTIYTSAFYLLSGAPATNDWTYAPEAYSSVAGDWVSLGTDGVDYWDATSNFTKTQLAATKSTWGNRFYIKGGRAYSGRVTVNALDRVWIRFRIIGTGTGTPTITTVAGRWNDCTAVNTGWRVYEKYTYEVKVVDTAGTAISGATVVIKDSFGLTISTQNTTAGGTITAVNCSQKEIYFDPYNVNGYTHTTAGTVQKDYGDYTVTISKSGYVTKTIPISMTQKRVEVEVLELSVISIDQEGL